MLKFSKDVVTFCKTLPKEAINIKLDQLVRSSTSIGANRREANDALGKKDFVHKLRIARKEAKKTIYWLKLVKHNNTNKNTKADRMIEEAVETRNILLAIISKVINK